MLVTIKRPFWSLGALAFFVFALWEVYHNASGNRRLHEQFFNVHLDENVDEPSLETHLEVFSASTTDREYFTIDFGDQSALNPNIIPHPVLEETWIVVGQLIQDSHYSNELVCSAVFENDTLTCVGDATVLPIASTHGDKCEGDLYFLNLNEGPHDARVFYGPTLPYTIFGSNSQFTCFGQWIQDFRMLTDWKHEEIGNEEFVHATELQRPMPYGRLEKNWFLFWDKDDQLYAHYDIVPRRVFAKLGSDGSVGIDLGPMIQSEDEKCMTEFMPKIGPELESIHQATNSLKVTMCKRSDRACIPDDFNTFILVIFQHKTYFNYHSIYEPYVMLFQQTAPFAIHAISKRPFWIHGRKSRNPNSLGVAEESNPESTSQLNDGEMFYITSMSWKKREQKYHGFIDDTIFISFGIEDKRTAGIDIIVGDLLNDLGMC